MGRSCYKSNKKYKEARKAAEEQKTTTGRVQIISKQRRERKRIKQKGITR